MKRSDNNWVERLDTEEIIQGDNGKPMVLLSGLRRLARLAGMNGCSIVLTSVPVGDRGVIQCVYTATFDDGTSWAGSADVNKSNCEEPFSNYPTAVAESRAAARCLKVALGIPLLSAEEVGFDESPGPRPTGKIDQQVVRLCETLINRKNLDPTSLFQNILTKERVEQVVELKDLTTTEGQAAVQWLNTTKSVPKKQKSDRDAKKVELKRQLEKKDG